MIGVKYTCSQDPSGYSQASRMDIVSLFSSGINLTIQPQKQMAEHTDYGLAGDVIQRLKNRDIPYKIHIFHLTPDLLPTYQEKNTYTIQRLAWETDRLPKEWISPLNNIDEIFCMSSQMADMIRESGVTTLCTPFPQPIDTGKAYEKIEPFSLEIPKDFIFYTIGQWISRKNFRGLLRAYWKAFSGEDNVSLLLKTYRVNYSNDEYNLIKRDIENWKKELSLKHYSKVLLTSHLLSEDQIWKLHALGDSYVSPSSGEGWSRGFQEAITCAKPVISSENGGITDYLTNQYFKVQSRPTHATEQTHIPWYVSSMKWREIDEESLGTQMCYVFENYQKALEKAHQAQTYCVDHFSFRVVGDMMKNRLEEISKTL